MTLPSAQEYLVESIHEELRALYPALPPCINFYTEPSGDFGIAHFFGLDTSTIAKDDFIITFDKEITSRYVICHEMGHALSLNVTLLRGGDPFTNGLYDEFWTARGFPGTPMEAQQTAIAKEAVALNSGYHYWPEENFADAFGAVNSYGQGTLITETYGAYLDEARLRAFFKSLKGEYETVALTTDEIDAIAAKTRDLLLPGLLEKIDSGFNTTLPILLDRLAAGDKKVETEIVDP